MCLANEESSQIRTINGVGKTSNAEIFFIIILISNHGVMILSLFLFEKFSIKHLQQTGGRNVKGLLPSLNAETQKS